MGKFEYEGNTIPISRMFIEYFKDDYFFYHVNIFNALVEQMIIYANSQMVKDINSEKLAKKLITKNYSLFQHIKYPDLEYGNNFWWDVKSDYFVFLEKTKNIIETFILECLQKDGGKQIIKKVNKLRI